MLTKDVVSFEQLGPECQTRTDNVHSSQFVSVSCKLFCYVFVDQPQVKMALWRSVNHVHLFFVHLKATGCTVVLLPFLKHLSQRTTLHTIRSV